MATRVSSAKADTTKGGLNFEEGWGEVVECNSIVHQFPASKETGEQYDAGCNVRFMIQRTDPDGKHTADEPIEEFFSVGRLEEFHPGKADGPDDDEPDDLGDDLGTEGNTVVSVNGKKFNQNSKWIRLANSLEAKGFSSEVLSRTYMPDFVGLKAFFTTITLPKGRGYTGKNEPKALVVDKITVKPYEKKGKGGAAGKGAAPAPAAKKPAAKAAAEEPDEVAAAGTNGDGELDSLAAEQLKKVALKAGAGTLTHKQLLSKLISVMAGKVPVKHHKAIQEKVKDAEWLEAQAAENEWGFDAEEGVTFPG